MSLHSKQEEEQEARRFLETHIGNPTARHADNRWFARGERMHALQGGSTNTHFPLNKTVRKTDAIRETNSAETRATIPRTPGLPEVGRYLLIEPNDLVHFVVVLEELAQLARVQSPVAVRAAAVLPRAGHLLLRSCG